MSCVQAFKANVGCHDKWLFRGVWRAKQLPPSFLPSLTPSWLHAHRPPAQCWSSASLRQPRSLTGHTSPACAYGRQTTSATTARPNGNKPRPLFWGVVFSTSHLPCLISLGWCQSGKWTYAQLWFSHQLSIGAVRISLSFLMGKCSVWLCGGGISLSLIVYSNIAPALQWLSEMVPCAGRGPGWRARGTVCIRAQMNVTVRKTWQENKQSKKRPRGHKYSAGKNAGFVIRGFHLSLNLLLNITLGLKWSGTAEEGQRPGHGHSCFLSSAEDACSGPTLTR